MEGIQQTLQHLQQTLKSASVDRHDEAAQLARDLYSLCLERGSDAELAYTTSVLFSSENGVLQFLRAAASMDEFSACKEELLRLLVHYLQALSKTLLPYTVDIKDVCLMLFARDKTSKVKAAIFPVLTEVLQLCAHTAVAPDLNISQMGKRFFEACMKPAKLTATVRGGVFHILGTLCEMYPEHMTLYSDKLVDVYLRTLKGEMLSKTKKPEMLVIAGCLRGLNGYLTNFEHTPSAASGTSSYAQDIYRFTRMAIDPEVSLSRFDVPRSGLSLLSKHAALFGELLTRDHHSVYQHLFRWCNHNNREMTLLGFRALEAFLQQVSEFLLKESTDKETRKAIFTEFIQNFRSIIDDKGSEHRQMAVAIRGYGYFAAPCRLFMAEGDVKFMFNEMIQRSEQLFFSQGGVMLGDIALYHLPTFLEALASILKRIDKLSESFVSFLERLVVVLVEHYPRLAPSSMGPVCHKVILLVLIALAGKGPILQSFVSHVVYQGLIRTCSHQVVLDSGEGSTGVPVSDGGGEGLDVLGTRMASYLDYIGIWVALCSRDAVKGLRNMSVEGTTSLRMVNSLVFDELMAAVLKMVDKLDLSSQFVDQGEEAATGGVSEKTQQGGVAPAPDAPSPTQPHLGLSLQPTKPPDFHIFLNLVDFFRTVIPKVDPPELMEKWMFTIVYELITQSSKQPIISGFYKMLGTCMVVCKRIDYFRGGGAAGGGGGVEEMETEAASDLANRRACFSLMKKFTKEVLVRMKQYKDDLVASCLVLLLSLPTELVEQEVQGLMAALQTALWLGLGYPPLARAALDALDTWSTSLPPSLLQPYYRSLLPVLDDYLKAASDEGDKGTLPPMSTSLTSNTSKKRLPGKTLKDWREGIEGAQSPTALIRLRVIHLLGSLGGQVNKELATSDSEALKKAVAWDTQKRLEFVLPFQDLKPSVFLDPFLPRVCELALTSSDRQTKIASCELLHAVVLYVVGRGAQPGATKKYPMTKVYQKLFPVILQLACDMERVAEQLFRPLVFQLVHWFTGNTQYESPDTISLLEAFLEGIVHPTDASLRDFSAQCVKEFLHWSIKQTTKQQQEKSPINTKSLLKRLYSLASHPSAAKRLGAALAFNAIYTVFREEKSLVDVFVMEMLVCVVNSLKQAHKDPKSLGTQEQLCKSVAHLARIIRAWANLLNKPGKLRRKPRGMRGSEMPHLVAWIIAQCGTPETECRKQCMGLFVQLAPLQQGSPSPREWVKRTVESEGGFYFVEVFENGGQPYSGILNHPTLTGDVFAVSAALHWFDLLLAAIDAYTWALEKKLLGPSEVFSLMPHKPSDKDSKLFTSLNFFLEHLALEGIHAAAKCFTSGLSQESTCEVFTPQEVDEYNRAKCVVTLGVLRFVSALLQSHSEETFSCTPRSFWSEPLYSTVVHCCLLPQQAGFDPGDIETAAKLPMAVLDCLNMLASRLPKDDKGTFLTFLSQTLLGENSNIAHQLREFPQGVDRSHLKALLNGYLTLGKAGLLKPALKDCSSLAYLLLDSVMKMMHSAAAAEGRGESPVRCRTLDPEEQQLARKLLDLALELGVEGKELLMLLFSGAEGHIFYQSLQPQICSHLARNQEAFIPALMEEVYRAPEVATSIIGGIVEQVLRELSLRRRYSSSLYRILLESWGRLGFLWGEQFSLDLRMTAISLLKKVLALEPKGLTSLDKSAFECVFGMMQTLLEETQTGLSFKAQVLELLPYFGSVKGTYATQLRDSLNKMIAAQFPLRSSEFAAGSSQYHEYTAAINKLLNGLVAMDTTVLLEVVVGVMCREVRHAHEEQMQMKLVEFVRGLSSEKARAALDSVYAFFTNHSQYDPQVRRAAAERVLLTLLRNCSEVPLREFFIQHISEVMAIIEAKETKVSDSHLETQLSSKICCFKLVEVAYTRLSALDLNSSESQLNEAYNGGDKKTGKELTKAATKMAHATRSEYVLDDAPAIKALRRECHCAAYNLLVAVISCTQSKMDFYSVFLFKEDVSKGQMLWDNLVDPDHQYNFGVELDAPLVCKKQLTTIRDEYHTAGREEGENGGSPLSPPPDPTRYLSSIYLAGSSLSQDVSQYDFSTGTQVVPRVSYPTGEGREAGNSYVVSEEQVEQDELNTHECMSTLTTLLDHMEHNRINPQVPKGHQPTEMPAWMSALHKKLTDGKTQNNIRLFITRLITNRPRVFQPYAKFWLAPLAQLVVAGHLGGKGMHYFLVDVMVTMLSWSTTAVLEDSYLATRLLEFLMDNCHHDNRGVFRNNLEIIKTLVECWKDHLNIPAESVYRHFSDPESDSKRNRTGIQLLGIVLANGLPPYNTAAVRGVSEESYYRALVGNLGNKYKEVYTAAAEVLGMTLNYISEHTHTDAGPLHDIITEQLQSLLQQRNEDRFTVCLHKLAEVYPPLVERLYSKVLFILPGQSAFFKTLSLETLLTRADTLPNLYQELKAKGFLALLGHRDEAMQLASLQLARVMVRTMPVDQLIEVLPSLTAFSTHSSAQCRSAMYDILIWVYNSIHGSESDDGPSQAQQISQTVRDHLLAGLSDDTEANRLKLFEFWNEDSRLPSDTLGRLSQLLAVLYSPSTEGQFLSCCTNLMLQLTWRSPDYSRPLFEVPLSECKFQDQSIDLSWQQRHLQMTPLFAATQASQPGSGPAVPMAQGMLRATQQAGAFVPTQDLAPGDSVGYNWMAPMQQSLDSLSFTIGAGSTVPEPQQSSLLFSMTKARQTTFKTLKPQGETLGKEALQLATSMGTQQPSDSSVGQQHEIMRLKRRFHADRQATRSFFGRLQTRKKFAQEEARQYQKAARDSRVVMYRQYREGELPDIQIKYSELIRPLQALAQRDNVLARQLFAAVFCAVFGQVDRQLPEREAESTRKAVEDGINAVLSASVQYVPSFIGSLLDICFQEKELEVNPHTSASACLASSQQPMGIMVLEKQQLYGTSEDSSRASKRSRGTRQVTSKATSNWIELARLYKSLGEYDVLHGVFSGHIGAETVTKEALAAEERGDYKGALDQYKEALSKDWSDEPPTEAEEDFWERAQLNCYDHLTKWKELEQAVEVNIDDHKPPNLDKIWEDAFYQEHYLPYLVRSKLKLASVGVSDTAFDSFLESSLQEESKRVVLESRYSAELAMHYILKDDYNRAKYYTDISMQGFLQEWSTLSPLFEENRAASLRGLQKIVEVKEFLEFASKAGGVISVAAIDKLLQKWNARFPHPKRDPVSVWDDIVTNRCVLMEKMLKCHTSAADVSMSSMESMKVECGSSYLKQLQLKFSREYVALYFKIAESARLQGNYPVAKHYLQLIDSAIKKHLQDDQELPLKWLWSVTEMRLRQAREDPSPRCIEAIFAVVKQFAALTENNELLTSSPAVARQHHLLHARALHHVGDVMLDMATGPRLMESYTDDKLQHFLAVASPASQVEPTSLSHQEVAHLLHQRALSTYKQGYKAAQTEQETTNDTGGMVDALVALATFCDKALRAEEEQENPTKLDLKTFPKVVVAYTLKAMQLGSLVARQQFPRLLQLLELYPQTVDDFSKKAREVPVWMFLGWRNQMMALLDKPEGRALHDIMFSLVREYPQALCYSFKISSSSFTFDTSTEEGQSNRAAVEEMTAMLEMRAVDDFVAALEQLTSPELLWKDLCDTELKPLMEVSQRDSTAIKACWQQIYTSLLAGEGRSTLSVDSLYSSASSSQLLHGQKRKNFVNAYRATIESKFGKDGAKLISMSITNFNKIVQSLNGDMRDKMQKVSGSGLLKDYSPWLAAFQANQYPQEIEVPGQYNGDRRPMLEYHVKIAGFDEKILVLNSIRKPKRITIRGDDEWEYPFLVKGGEDLRLDQRIEQLFGIMNQVLREDPACCQRGLSLRTYKVVPMTPRVGVIEWLQHTKPLKEFLLETMTEEEAKKYQYIPKMQQRWLAKNGRGSDLQVYKAMYRSANRTETVNEYKKKVAMVPWDLSRRAFMQLAASPEAFLMLRSHFIRTYATLCMCHYVLGIGDRHLSNFMVDLHSGGAIGIDFGHAFGTATQFLPLPELIPFRLTPQIVNLLRPLSESGQLRSCMVHSMRALRTSPLLLLNTMEVFIKEPSLDWKVNAKKQAATVGMEEDSQEADWYPREKVDLAKKKLQGFNPAHLMKKDLVQGHGRLPEYSSLDSLLMGDRQHNIRAVVEVHCSSVEEQVACLIDLATDTNILGRTWQGWEPWV